MNWDAARVAAAVPSGVGFLGAGLIWKGSTSTAITNGNGEVVNTTSQEVHGLTTAASVWLSAAVGVAVGGGRRLYITSMYGVGLVILILRLLPQIFSTEDSDSMQDFDDDLDLDSDWDSCTDESSQDLSAFQLGDDREVEDREYRRESTMSGSYGIIAKRADEPREHRSRLSTLSKNSSAPNLTMMDYEAPIVDHSKEKNKELLSCLVACSMDYELPIVDHSKEKKKESKQTRRPARRAKGANKMALSFHA